MAQIRIEFSFNVIFALHIVIQDRSVSYIMEPRLYALSISSQSVPSTNLSSSTNAAVHTCKS